MKHVCSLVIGTNEKLAEKGIKILVYILKDLDL